MKISPHFVPLSAARRFAAVMMPLLLIGCPAAVADLPDLDVDRDPDAASNLDADEPSDGASPAEDVANDTPGDGVELPDDGSLEDGDDRPDTGPPPRCGDGNVDPGEACDDGDANANDVPGACREDCTRPRCGDGVVDPGEQCEPPGERLCSSTCQTIDTDLCATCSFDPNCGRAQDACVDLIEGRRCARACASAIDCPLGFVCEETRSQEGAPVRQCLPEGGTCAGCFDPDGDGYGVGTSCLGPDCAPNDPAIHPGATEVCNGLDDNCNGQIDEGLPVRSWWPDGDRDGFGAASASAVRACERPINHVGNNDDCDDTRAAVNPNALELCSDGLDNDCNGQTDCDDAACTNDAVCRGCAGGPFAGNRTRATAALVTPQTWTDIPLCSPEEHWYRVNVPAAGSLEVEVRFVHAEGDIDLELVDASGAVLERSTGVTDVESVRRTASSATTYWVRVFVFRATGAPESPPTRYAMTVAIN